MVMAMGVPKEIKTLEKRVGLTPQGVRSLQERGHCVLVQKGAGEGSGFSDEDYRQAGAEVVPDAKELYQRAGLILKIKEPLPPEFVYFRPGLVLFSFLHLAAPAACDLVRALKEQQVTALAFETLTKNGARPLLTPMSEIAGALAGLYALSFLKKDLLRARSLPGAQLKAGMEEIAAAYPELPEDLYAAKVVVFGGGIAGYSAARAVLKAGSEVVVLETNPRRVAELNALFPEAKGRFQAISPENLPDLTLEKADVLIGAVHQTGRRAVQVLNKTLLASVCRDHPKMIMDISIDQGGNFPEAVPTSYEDPLYRDSLGNLRFCVPNIPSLAGRYASQTLTELILPYAASLAESGLEGSLKAFPEMESAVNTQEGRILLDPVREAHGL